MTSKVLSPLFFPSLGLTYISNGLHLVVLGWLAQAVFASTPLGVGIVMALLIIPQALLLPVMGRWVDVRGAAKVAKLGCWGLALSHGLFAFTLSWQPAGGVVLALYALALGVSLAAFLPAKDKACAQRQDYRLQKNLAFSNLFQFGGLFIGSMLGGLLTVASIEVLLVSQVALTAVSGFIWRHFEFQDSIRSSAEVGLPERVSSEQNKGMVQLLLVCAFCGFFHLGFSLTLFPILGIQVWSMDAKSYGLMQALFTAGGIAVYFANALRKPHQYPGQALLFCLLYTAAIAYAITRGPTVTGAYGLIFLWGAVAGYSASMARIVLHSLVADEQRGQASARYQVTLLLSAPVGALVSGLALHWLSLNDLLRLVAVVSAVFFALFLLTRELWSVKQVSAE